MTRAHDPERARRAASLHQTAHALAREGRLEAAIPLWGEALGLDPTNVDVLLGLGHALAALGERAQAKDLAERAARLTPDAAEPWLLLGHVALDDGDGQGALEAYLLAEERAPSSEAVHVAKARVLLASGHLDPAEASLQKAGSSFEAQMLRGQAHALRGRLDDARQAFADAGALNPEHPEPYKQLAILVGGSDPALAEELLLHALEIAPGDREASDLLRRIRGG